MIKHINEDTTPIIAGTWFLVDNHCSKKTVKNKAVKAKSIPWVLKLINVPINTPIIVPNIQYKW